MDMNNAWINFSRNSFFYCYIVFSFAIFSSALPVGVISVFSTFAFIFALPLFIIQIKSGWRLTIFEKIGLILFVWLALSILWSEASYFESSGALMEYRFYFMLPVFIAAFAFFDDHQKNKIFFIGLIGCVVALVSSYLLGYGFIYVEGAENSLGNKIFHAFIMSFFYLILLFMFRFSKLNNWCRYGCLVLAFLVAYNVFNVETGRTGYLQIATVTLLFFLVSLSFKRFFIALSVFVASLLFSYLNFDNFGHRIDATVANVEKMIVSNDYSSSAGQRLEYYRGAILISKDYPVLGVGVGDYDAELKHRFEVGQIRRLTDNVHSEFLNMLVVGGYPALLLFFGFILGIGWLGVSTHASNPVRGKALVCFLGVVAVSALFNSTIKDYGEKHALLVMFPLLLSLLNGRVTKATVSRST